MALSSEDDLSPVGLPQLVELPQLPVVDLTAATEVHEKPERLAELSRAAMLN
jgi:hypothetical protein